MADHPQRVRFSWRRYVRFSLRALIVLVLCISCGLGFLVHEAQVQREAVAAIVRTCGTVYYNWKWNNDRFIPPRKLWAPQRLIDFIGIDYFGHVTAVRLSKPDDAALAHVGRLAGLQQLSFRRWPENTAGLEQLKGLSELTGLYCGSGTITDDDMAILKDMTRLTRLTIDPAGGVTDAGLAHLKRMVRLTELRLPRSQVTDAGLAHLNALTKLSILDIGGARVTDAGLENLKGLTKLNVLFLQGARVTQAGIDELKRFLPSLNIIR